ncbi:MAG: HEAT repeat domain-containing protein [Clostridia bacterium]|nr:HEAT repeat domain-containing protein [Clostridia bacterium]
MFIIEKDLSEDILKDIKKYTKRKKFVKLAEMLSYKYSIERAAKEYSWESSWGYTHKEEKIRLIESYSAKIRKEAAIALGIVAKEEAYDPLLNAIGDINADVRRCAEKSLEQIGHTEWQDIVKGDSDDYKRMGASQDQLAVIPLSYALKCTDDRETEKKLSAAFKQLALDIKSEAAFNAMAFIEAKSLQRNLRDLGV